MSDSGTIPTVVVVKKSANFATMDRAKFLEASRKGGVTAHAKGTAYRFTREDAIAASRLGVLARNAKKQQQESEVPNV